MTFNRTRSLSNGHQLLNCDCVANVMVKFMYVSCMQGILGAICVIIVSAADELDLTSWCQCNINTSGTGTCTALCELLTHAWCSPSNPCSHLIILRKTPGLAYMHT